MIKTNAMRILDAAGIKYDIGTYAWDESDLSGVHAAEVLGLPPETLFKTLVTRFSDSVVVCCIPVAEELDLKKAAAAAHEKKLDMLHVKELEQVTGYIRGGCSPIGMKKKFPVVIDETCILYEKIGISAGKRGVQMLLAPDDLINFTGAVTADITAR